MKHPTNFIRGSFHQSTEPVVRSFFRALCHFVQRNVDNCLLDLMSRLIPFIKFSWLTMVGFISGSTYVNFVDVSS